MLAIGDLFELPIALLSIAPLSIVHAFLAEEKFSQRTRAIVEEREVKGATPGHRGDVFATRRRRGARAFR